MNSVFLKKFVVLFIILCATKSFTQEAEMLLSSNQVYPLSPVFIRVTTPIEGKRETPIAIDPSGKKLKNIDFVKLDRFKYKDEKIVEEWFLIFIPEQFNKGKIFCVLPKTKKQVEFSILPIPDELKNDFTLYKNNKLTGLAGILLDRSTIQTEFNIDQIKNLAEHKTSSYGYVANFVLGCMEFNSLVKKFNNNGPPGAYQSCYKALELVAESKKHSPLQLEAQRRLFAAKACNSDYDESKKLAELLSNNKISRAYSDLGKKALQGIPKFIKSKSK